MNPVPGLEIAEHYRLVKPLGNGGSGSVWLAQDLLADIDVAMKFYGSFDDFGLSEFRKEYKLGFKLNHPNLLNIRHFDVFENCPYLVMTYCKNGSLARKAGKMNEEEVWRFVENVASGLAYLHSQRPHIIHQDIKPDNILIDDDGSFLISDFGISRKFLSTQAKMMSTTTASQTSAGTMPYMGPERFSENPMVIMASDIWSFGMTLYELITGELMWEGMGGCAQLNGAKLPNKVNELPQLLSLLIKACLEQEPWNRPTAAQIAKFAKTRDLADLNNSKKTINPSPIIRDPEPPRPEPTNTNQRPVTSPTPIRPVYVRPTPTPPKPTPPKPKTQTDSWLDKLKKMDTRHLIALIAGILLLFVFVGGAIYVVLNDMNEKTEFKNCTTYDDFNNFINKYPDSKFINAARNKMRELQPKPLYEKPSVPDVPQKVIKKSFTISNNGKGEPNSNKVSQDQLAGKSNKGKKINGKNKTKNQDNDKDDVEETLLYDPVTKKLIKITKKK
ncbi:MAG: protein kinase [Prevotella sp.]|nr:protein kinase [Prevotella sp.]